MPISTVQLCTSRSTDVVCILPLSERGTRTAVPVEVQVSVPLVGQDLLVGRFLKVAQKYVDIFVNHCTTHQKLVLT